MPLLNWPTPSNHGAIVRDMTGRKGVDEILYVESEPCFSSDKWIGIMEGGGVRFGDGERVEWAMAAILCGVKEPNAPSLYQVCIHYFLPPRVKMSSRLLYRPSSSALIQQRSTLRSSQQFLIFLSK